MTKWNVFILWRIIGVIIVNTNEMIVNIFNFELAFDSINGRFAVLTLYIIISSVVRHVTNHLKVGLFVNTIIFKDKPEDNKWDNIN